MREFFLREWRVKCGCVCAWIRPREEREWRRERIDNMVAWKYECCMEILDVKVRWHPTKSTLPLCGLGPRMERGKRRFLGFLPLSPY